MKIGGGLLLWSVILAVFFRCYAREQAADRPLRRRPPPADAAGNGAAPLGAEAGG